jgi:hypothetical protein
MNEKPKTDLPPPPPMPATYSAPAEKRPAEVRVVRSGPGCLSGCRNLLVTALIVVVAFLGGIGLTQFGILDALFGFGPPQVTVDSVLEQVQLVQELVTSRYLFSTIVNIERDLPPILQALYRDSLTLVGSGTVVAGIDLEQLRPEDIILTVSNTPDLAERVSEAISALADGRPIKSPVVTVIIRLPAPQIFDCFLDESRSYVASRTTGLFARQAPEFDTTARQRIVSYLYDEALESGILTDAGRQAEVALVSLIRTLNPLVGEITVMVPALDGETQFIDRPSSCGGAAQ